MCMYFMSTACGRPQGVGGSAHVDACGQGKGGQKPDFFVDVINGWPLIAEEIVIITMKLIIGLIAIIPTSSSKGVSSVYFIHSFILVISIAPLPVLYYSEALPTTARILYRSFTPKRTGNCR